MSLDLTILAPKARADYLRIGRQYGSTDTLNQANKTLEGLGIYAAELKLHGFGPADQKRLADARDGLIAAGAGRTEQAGQRKVTSKAFVAALSAAKTARVTARSILDNALTTLEDAGDETTARKIEVALDQTRSSQDVPEKLAVQLDSLRDALGLEVVKPIVQDRGGPEAVLQLKDAAEGLRSAAKERAGGGTVAATEQLDVLDGIVVTLARAARKAARAAARKLEQPAIAAAFELTHLYGTRSGQSGAAEGEEQPPTK